MSKTSETREAARGSFQVRAALPADVPAVVDLVRALADYEKLAPPDDEAAARFSRDAVSGAPPFHLLVAEVEGGELCGYAAYLMMYSTFLARPTLFLEDLFVRPDARGRGIGEAMLRRLAAIAVERGCGRFDWCVLDWNEGAQRFYRRLGAEVLSHWWTCRLEGPALAAVAAGDTTRT